MNHDPVLLLYDEAMLGHDPSGWDPDHPEWTAAVQELLAEVYPDKDLSGFAHPERPQRLLAIVEHLRRQQRTDVRWQRPRRARVTELQRVHAREHVRFVRSLRHKTRWLSQDTTAISPGSVAAALAAAGAGMTAIDSMAKGDARKAFCLVRPPGHHALADSAMGFCLFNNLAVAAAHARAILGVQRILVWDWDLHHGNGTQDIFYEDPGVLVVDSHCQAPFYPGGGHLEETGRGAGEGFHFNVPLPPGSGNTALLDVASKIVEPTAQAFQPELVLVSAGFDGHHLDQTFAMDEHGFGAIAAAVRDIADRTAAGRMLVCLEGGYHADALAGGAAAVVDVLAGARPKPPEPDRDDPGRGAVTEAAQYHAAAIEALRR